MDAGKLTLLYVEVWIYFSSLSMLVYKALYLCKVQPSLQVDQRACSLGITFETLNLSYNYSPFLFFFSFSPFSFRKEGGGGGVFLLTNLRTQECVVIAFVDELRDQELRKRKCTKENGIGLSVTHQNAQQSNPVVAFTHRVKFQQYNTSFFHIRFCCCCTSGLYLMIEERLDNNIIPKIEQLKYRGFQLQAVRGVWCFNAVFIHDQLVWCSQWLISRLIGKSDSARKMTTFMVTPILVDCCHSWCYTGEIYDDLVETFFFCGLVVSCKSRWKVSVGKLCKECLCSNYMKCILPCCSRAKGGVGDDSLQNHRPIIQPKFYQYPTAQHYISQKKKKKKKKN
ncbi:hypothetical protein VP01_1398g1 [Puccinia sorghi]|uniref:Uncharacterized protein n=1 Tax=Puccinia sorghi TaxID=27349 RepID=A0A0L6VL13_9BASI|nr:hypothetical protein VP01_1398g1 [Puccinia sorghi]